MLIRSWLISLYRVVKTYTVLPFAFVGVWRINVAVASGHSEITQLSLASSSRHYTYCF